jgi:hypothetical protein
MRRLKNNRGVTVIALIIMMLILAVMGTSLISLVATENTASIGQVKSTQAHYIAEGGLDYILAANVFPNYSTNGSTKALGAGSFKTDTPAYLTAALSSGATTVTVNSTTGFSGSGRITIDSEVIVYTGTTPTTFTGATRGVDGTASVAHASGNAVYPVTRLTADPGAGGATLNVNSTTGFVVAGVIKIENEYIYCTGSTGITFTNCTRGYRGTTAAAHASGTDVFQYIATSTGTVSSAFGNTQRVMRTSVDGRVPTTIAFDAASSTNGNTASLTWSHTVSGTNRFLIVGVSMKNDSNQSVTSVSYAGVQLIYIDARSNGTNARVELWGKTGVPTGANNVIVTLNASARVVGGAVSLTGVSQTNNGIDASNFHNSGTSLTPSVTVTTVADNAWVVSTVASSPPTSDAATSGAGHDRRWNDLTGGTGSTTHVRGAGSTFGPKTPPGNVPMSWTLGALADWAIAAVAVKPVTSSVTMLDWQEVFP